MVAPEGKLEFLPNVDCPGLFENSVDYVIAFSELEGNQRVIWQIYLKRDSEIQSLRG